MTLGYVLALQEDFATPAILTYYNDGIQTPAATPADLAAATFFADGVAIESDLHETIGNFQAGTADRYVSPRRADRTVSLTGAPNGKVLRARDNIASTVPLGYWNGSEFTAGATQAELDSAELYLNTEFNEADLMASRGFVQRGNLSVYVDLIPVAAVVALVP
jgi:hypothetical protein